MGLLNYIGLGRRDEDAAPRASDIDKNKASLRAEFQAGRITADEFSKRLASFHGQMQTVTAGAMRKEKAA